MTFDVEVDTIHFVTNGAARLIFIPSEYMAIISTNGWPQGAAMFVRGQFNGAASYLMPGNVRLVGYGTWPTNNFQSVWWRSGTNIFVNILIEE